MRSPSPDGYAYNRFVFADMLRKSGLNGSTEKALSILERFGDEDLFSVMLILNTAISAGYAPTALHRLELLLENRSDDQNASLTRAGLEGVAKSLQGSS